MDVTESSLIKSIGLVMKDCPPPGRRAVDAYVERGDDVTCGEGRNRAEVY